jgi:hypothetical protein
MIELINELDRGGKQSLFFELTNTEPGKFRETEIQSSNPEQMALLYMLPLKEVIFQGK